MGNKNVPEVRFPGFFDAWEQHKYGEVIDLLSGQDFSPSEYNDTGDGIPYMTGASCIVGKETIVNRWTTVPRCLAERGDVLLVCKGSGYGAIAVMAQDKAHIARQFMALKNLPSLDKVFNFYLLNSVIENIKKDARGLIAGIARDAVLKQEINIPLLEEQAQIGTLLKTLDDLITLHQRELKTLKQTKQGFLQKMFPKEGESVPEVRFPGFSGEWKVCRLRDITERVRGNDGRMDLPTLTISAGKGWLDQRERFAANIAGQEQINYTLLSKGSLSYNKGNSKLAKYGVVFELKNYEEALVPRVYHSFKTNELANSTFIEYMFSTKIPDRELAKLITSGARMDGLLNINYEDFVGIKVKIPSMIEQIKIVEFLRSLDKCIALKEKELESLQQTKKAFLQKMFV